MSTTHTETEQTQSEGALRGAIRERLTPLAKNELAHGAMQVLLPAISWDLDKEILHNQVADFDNLEQESDHTVFSREIVKYARDFPFQIASFMKDRNLREEEFRGKAHSLTEGRFFNTTPAELEILISVVLDRLQAIPKMGLDLETVAPFMGGTQPLELNDDLSTQVLTRLAEVRDSYGPKRSGFEIIINLSTNTNLRVRVYNGSKKGHCQAEFKLETVDHDGVLEREMRADQRQARIDKSAVQVGEMRALILNPLTKTLEGSWMAGLADEEEIRDVADKLQNEFVIQEPVPAEILEPAHQQLIEFGPCLLDQENRFVMVAGVKKDEALLKNNWNWHVFLMPEYVRAREEEKQQLAITAARDLVERFILQATRKEPMSQNQAERKVLTHYGGLSYTSRPPQEFIKMVANEAPLAFERKVPEAMSNWVEDQQVWYPNESPVYDVPGDDQETGSVWRAVADETVERPGTYIYQVWSYGPEEDAETN